MANIIGFFVAFFLVATIAPNLWLYVRAGRDLGSSGAYQDIGLVAPAIPFVSAVFAAAHAIGVLVFRSKWNIFSDRSRCSYQW